jgi:hypothetical protein
MNASEKTNYCTHSFNFGIDIGGALTRVCLVKHLGKDEHQHIALTSHQNRERTQKIPNLNKE